jgi:membrane-associated phospholipid phosphatase
MNSIGGSSIWRRYGFVDYATQAYIAVAGLLILLFHNHTVPHWARLLAIHAALLVLIHGLIAAEARWPHPIVGFLRHFYPVLLFAWLYSETGWINRMFFAQYIDTPFIRLEQSLFGCQPSIVLMERFPFIFVSEVLYASYFSYYLMIGGVGFYLLFKKRAAFFHYVSVVSFIFYVCYLTYIFLPVVGPPLFFNPVERHNLPAEFHALAQHAVPAALVHGPFYRIMAWIYEVVEAPGAAFPSSHVAIAWTTVYFSFRYIRSVWFPHAFVALLLTISTVYCRYHYAIDVLGGLLTTAVLLPVANLLYFRSLPASPGASNPTSMPTMVAPPDQNLRS